MHANDCRKTNGRRGREKQQVRDAGSEREREREEDRIGIGISLNDMKEMMRKPRKGRERKKERKRERPVGDLSSFFSSGKKGGEDSRRTRGNQQSRKAGGLHWRLHFSLLPSSSSSSSSSLCSLYTLFSSDDGQRDRLMDETSGQ
jgi:hypothetical protein